MFSSGRIVRNFGFPRGSYASTVTGTPGPLRAGRCLAVRNPLHFAFVLGGDESCAQCFVEHRFAVGISQADSRRDNTS